MNGVEAGGKREVGGEGVDELLEQSNLLGSGSGFFDFGCGSTHRAGEATVSEPRGKSLQVNLAAGAWCGQSAIRVDRVIRKEGEEFGEQTGGDVGEEFGVREVGENHGILDFRFLICDLGEAERIGRKTRVERFSRDSCRRAAQVGAAGDRFRFSWWPSAPANCASQPRLAALMMPTRAARPEFVTQRGADVKAEGLSRT